MNMYGRVMYSLGLRTIYAHVEFDTSCLVDMTAVRYQYSPGMALIKHELPYINNGLYNGPNTPVSWTL